MRCAVLQPTLAAVLAIVSNVAYAGFLTVRRHSAPPHPRGLHNREHTKAPLHGANLVIVAAHHEEDLAWLDGVAQHCGDCHVYVYTSSRARAGHTFRHGTVREVPNVGREWGKYLRFITDEWTALQRTNATILFAHAHQGPNGADDSDRGDVASVFPRWPASAADHILFVHGGETEISTGDGSVLDYGAVIRRVWPELFNELGNVPGTAPHDNHSLDLFCINGGEFSVPARQVVRRSRSFYERLELWLTTQSPSIVPASLQASRATEAVTFDYAAGTILELLAYRIFQGSDAMHTHAFVEEETLRSTMPAHAFVQEESFRSQF